MTATPTRVPQEPQLDLHADNVYPGWNFETRCEIEGYFIQIGKFLRLILEPIGYLGFFIDLEDPKMVHVMNELETLVGLSIGLSIETVQTETFNRVSDLIVDTIECSGELIAIGRWFKLDFAYLIPNFLLSTLLPTQTELALIKELETVRASSKRNVISQLERAIHFVTSCRDLTAEKDTFSRPPSYQHYGAFFLLCLKASLMRAKASESQE